MLKLTKTGIGLLTKQYKSVLRKCLLLNLGVSLFYSIPSAHAIMSGNCNWSTGECNLRVSGGTYFVLYTYDEVYNKNETYTKSEVNNIQSLNYYYTFRVDERAEAAEFALFLNNEKLSNVFEA